LLEGEVCSINNGMLKTMEIECITTIWLRICIGGTIFG
jgi:hypothetical protein